MSDLLEQYGENIRSVVLRVDNNTEVDFNPRVINLAGPARRLLVVNMPEGADEEYMETSRDIITEAIHDEEPRVLILPHGMTIQVIDL